MVSEKKYNCYGFNLDLGVKSIVTFAYASSHFTEKEAEVDIIKRFAPNKVGACFIIEDPMKDVMSTRQSNKEYYDEAGGIKLKKDLSSKRKRRLEEWMK